MNLIKKIADKLRRKPLLVKHIVMGSAFVVTAGIKCPKCNIYGLFKTEHGYRCEECLSYFDENKILISD